jgi:hypothetical protein
VTKSRFVLHQDRGRVRVEIGNVAKLFSPINQAIVARIETIWQLSAGLVTSACVFDRTSTVGTSSGRTGEKGKVALWNGFH